jgi:hypothetical protein
MKSKVTIFVTMLFLTIFGNLVFGQDDKGGAISIDEAAKLGKLPRGFQLDRYRRVPAGCPKGARAYVISRNATSGVSRSDNLNNFFGGFPREIQTRFPSRGYGERGPNRFFGDSFPLGNCKICAASMMAEVENEGADNDSLTIWLSDNTLLPIMTGNGGIAGNRLTYLTSYGTPGLIVGNPALWDGPAPSPKTISLDLNRDGNVTTSASPMTGISRINQYIFSSVVSPYLEVIVADDTKVNSLQMVIWR